MIVRSIRTIVLLQLIISYQRRILKKYIMFQSQFWMILVLAVLTIHRTSGGPGKAHPKREPYSNGRLRNQPDYIAGHPYQRPTGKERTFRQRETQPELFNEAREINSAGDTSYNSDLNSNQFEYLWMVDKVDTNVLPGHEERANNPTQSGQEQHQDVPVSKEHQESDNDPYQREEDVSDSDSDSFVDVWTVDEAPASSVHDNILPSYRELSSNPGQQGDQQQSQSILDLQRVGQYLETEYLKSIITRPEDFFGRIPPHPTLAIELFPKSGIYMNRNRLVEFHHLFSKQPRTLQRVILESLIPPHELVQMKPSHYLGSRAIPRYVLNAVEGFVNRFSDPSMTHNTFMARIRSHLRSLRQAYNVRD